MRPVETAKRGREIYESRLKEKLEPLYVGQYVAVDVTGDGYYIGKTPDEALRMARETNPSGIFHLMRIGFNGVYRLSSFRHGSHHRATRSR